MSLSSRTEIAQWCIIGIGGSSSLLCGLAVIYAIRAVIGVKVKPLYVPRSILGVCSVVLCGVQVLPALVALYGYSPPILCGVYICVTFGFLYPLVHWAVLCMLLHTVKKYDSCIASHTERHVTHVVNTSLLYSLPSILGQSIVAWIGRGFQNTSVVVDKIILLVVVRINEIHTRISIGL